jgi:hypothetical protein
LARVGDGMEREPSGGDDEQKQSADADGLKAWKVDVACSTNPDVIVIHPDLHGVYNPPVQTAKSLLSASHGPRKRRTSRFARRRAFEQDGKQGECACPSSGTQVQHADNGSDALTPTVPSHAIFLRFPEVLRGRFLAFGSNSVNPY